MSTKVLITCCSEVQEHMRQREMDGATVVLVAVSDTVAAALSIKDPVKPEAGRVVAALQTMGIQVGWLSRNSLETRMCNKGQICENKSLNGTLLH